METLLARDGALTRGNSTFQPERLEIILKNETFIYASESDLGKGTPWGAVYGPKAMACFISPDCFKYEKTEDVTRGFSNHNARLRATDFCRQFYGHDVPASVAVADLDLALSCLFKFKFETLERSRFVIEQACMLLERLPAWPPNLDKQPTETPVEYYVPSVPSNTRKDAPIWERLQATTYVSDTVLRAALAVVIIEPGSSLGSLLSIINILATLLEMTSRLASSIVDPRTAWRSFIARAFLWTTWQRCQILYFHGALGDALAHGSYDGKVGELSLRGTMPSPGTAIPVMDRHFAGADKSIYMCAWNFELLRTNAVCIGADFRRFHQRFNTAFDGYAARCLAGQQLSCEGNNPQNCQRFHGMVIKDQSAHDQSCSRDCKRMFWDETSYRAISGPTAACLLEYEDLTSQNIQYRRASHRTLAISHVWSHGQGGRPETGFNQCLHYRYSQIARSLACDAYWIDATCIPNSHDLRSEAISNINSIFMDAKIMLVCDRDIMELDISDLTTTVCETILVTIIVSDWNTRAWTFFEAFRARRTIHLLCRHNAVISLQEVIRLVHEKGALEIGNLVLAMPHFLPPHDDKRLAESKFEGSRERFQAGYLEIETSGSLLSHRPASRPGDDVVIWSLLLSQGTIFYDAESFWRSMQGSPHQVLSGDDFGVSTAMAIRTGYLLSSVPRLKAKGLGWAPASPTLATSIRSAKDELSSVYDGGDSSSGWVTPDGLVADWALWKFNTTDSWQLSVNPFPINLKRIKAQFLQRYHWGAILRPLEENVKNSDDEWEAWWSEGSRSGRKVVIVCGTNDLNGLVTQKYIYNGTDRTRPRWADNNEVVGWEWRGIYEWNDSEPLPEWKRARDFLIV